MIVFDSRGKLESEYCSDAGFNSDWMLGHSDGTYTDVIEALREAEGRFVRIVIEVVEP